jgi:hypothetical protein
MRDLVRGGIGAVPGKGFDFFDSQARRMVDAQSPGVARMVRELGSLASQGAGWQRPFVEQLSRLHLLSRALERFDQLPESARANVEAVLGVTIAADELKMLPAIADCWQIVAQEVELEDRLRVQRTWLHGSRTELCALILQFAHNASAFESSLSGGMQFQGELVFYPGATQRAAVRSLPAQIEPLTVLGGCESIEELLDRYSQSLANFPWLEQTCLPLKNVVPTQRDGRLWLIDRAANALPVRLRELVGFTLLAISGGQPIDIAADFNGQSIRPLSAVAGGRWISLAETIAEAA